MLCVAIELNFPSVFAVAEIKFLEDKGIQEFLNPY
jgi:hypothetical protein